MRSLGAPEILIIALVILLLFGAKKLPDLAKGLGEGIKNFKTPRVGSRGFVFRTDCEITCFFWAGRSRPLPLSQCGISRLFWRES